jgi:hypothetical protein
MSKSRWRVVCREEFGEAEREAPIPKLRLTVGWPRPFFESTFSQEKLIFTS